MYVGFVAVVVSAALQRLFVLLPISSLSRVVSSLSHGAWRPFLLSISSLSHVVWLAC